MVKTRLKLQLSCFLVATIILAMAMAPVTAVAQEQATKVAIPSVSIGEEASTTVPMTIQNTTDAVSSATVKLWFDPAVVNVTGITQGDFPGSFTPNTFCTADGWVKVVVDVGANPSLSSDNIIIANVTLKAVGSAEASSNLGLEVQSLLNDSFAAIPFTPVNGTFEISGIPPATKVAIPSVSIGEEASTTVPMTIQNTTDAVSSATVKLWFDPAVVNVTGITQGDFPGSFTPNTFCTADGWVKVVVDVGANPSLSSDNIIIANVTLKAVGSAEASSNLGLEVQSLLNDSFAAIPFTPVNGTFTVTTAGPTLTWQTEPPTPVTQGDDVTFDVSFSETADYYFRIENSTGGVVWRYPTSGNGSAMNPLAKTWTTTTDTPTGDYTIIININGVDNAATRTVTVNAAGVEAITVTPPIATLFAADTTCLFTADVADVTWSCDNASVGTIDSSTGLFTKEGVAGTATITASKTEYTDGTASVTVIVETIEDYYDTDNSGDISKDEAIDAVTDYLVTGDINKEQAVEIVYEYFFG